MRESVVWFKYNIRLNIKILLIRIAQVLLVKTLMKIHYGTEQSDQRETW